MASKTDAEAAAKHAALMADVTKTEAAAAAGSAKAKADLEAQDPGSTDPNRTDTPGSQSDGKPLKDPRISNDHQSPF